MYVSLLAETRTFIIGSKRDTCVLLQVIGNSYKRVIDFLSGFFVSCLIRFSSLFILLTDSLFRMMSVNLPEMKKKIYVSNNFLKNY